jgi:hypothetical protein
VGIQCQVLRYWKYYLLTYSLTHSLTPWSSLLSQLKFPTFYGNWRFITVFTGACHLSISHLHLTFWVSIILLSSHLYLGLPSVQFPWSFLTKTPYAPLLSPHTCYMPHPSHSRFYHSNNILCGEQIIKLLIMPLPLLPCYLSLLDTYFSQHPVLKHLHPSFLPHCERPSFTPIQNTTTTMTMMTNTTKTTHSYCQSSDKHMQSTNT